MRRHKARVLGKSGAAPSSRGACRVRAIVFVSPSKREEGAGKAGCPPHPWSACNKKHAAEPQVQADHPAFPAQWFYGLYVLSPVTIAWLPPSSAESFPPT